MSVTRRDVLKGAAALGVAGALPQALPRVAQAQTTQKRELVVAQGGDIAKFDPHSRSSFHSASHAAWRRTTMPPEGEVRRSTQAHGDREATRDDRPQAQGTGAAQPFARELSGQVSSSSTSTTPAARTSRDSSTISCDSFKVSMRRSNAA